MVNERSIPEIPDDSQDDARSCSDTVPVATADRNDEQGAESLRQLSQTPKHASAFGLQVARILDDIWALYNLPCRTTVDFSAEDTVKFRIGKSIATFDFDELTQLVVRCHDACIRLSIAGSGSYLSLCFTKRLAREGRFCDRHPTMEQAIERVRTRNYFTRHAPEQI